MSDGRKGQRVDCCNGEQAQDDLARRATAEEAEWTKTLTGAVSVPSASLPRIVRTPQWSEAKLDEKIQGMCRTRGVWRNREDCTIGQAHGADSEAP